MYSVTKDRFSNYKTTLDVNFMRSDHFKLPNGDIAQWCNSFSNDVDFLFGDREHGPEKPDVGRFDSSYPHSFCE